MNSYQNLLMNKTRENINWFKNIAASIELIHKAINVRGSAEQTHAAFNPNTYPGCKKRLRRDSPQTKFRNHYSYNI